MAALTLAEALERARLLTVDSYVVELDLDTGPETFASHTTVRFTCAEPGATSFVDLKSVGVESLSLNGRAIDPALVADERLVLEDLAADNELTVSATMRYSRDGQGLHRAVDPADGAAYVYGHLFLDAAPRVYACFDQPDLKAPYDVAVHAPHEWTVLGNGAARRDEGRGPGWWRLARTKPLATYFVTICAGPYASVRDEHRGIPLGVHARASLGERLAEQAPELLALTKAGLDHYEALFGSDYPFGEYHQVFVPEFNAGAMENPGCVTFRDQMIFRGAVGDAERMSRANTVLHEMAHMWFGDLVTMRWWDDLWLNESFAEFMASRACLEASEFTSAWTDFTIMRKTWGYAAERSPSTHPVAGNPPPDAASALHNFDGISYAKGAAVLGQLVAYLGQDAFDAGVRDYLAAHAYGNAALSDFLAAMSAASGRDLDEWSQAWLRTAGLDALAVDLRSDGARISFADVRREQPRGSSPDRPHAIDIAGYEDGQEVWRVPVRIDDDEVELRGLVGRPVPHVVIPDASSLTWASIRLSARTLAALPVQLSLVPDGTARAVVWAALLDGLHDAIIDPRALLEVVVAAWPRETDPSILRGVQLLVLPDLLRRYLPEGERTSARSRLAEAARRLAQAHRAGDSAYLAAVRGRAAWEDDEDYLRGLAGGDTRTEPLAGDQDLRWAAATTLARRGELDLAGIERMHAQDRTMTGELAALTARAALPGDEAKAWAWAELTGDSGRSNYALNALATGFWQARDEADVAGYAQRYFADIPALTGRVGEDALSRVAALAFPGTIVEESVAEAARERLADPGLGAAVRREMVDGLAALEQALASRRRYGG